MEVRKDYKQTIGVGVIPEDWEVDTLSSTTPRNVKNGIVDGPFGSNLKTIHYRKSGIPIITSGYVTEGNFHAEDYLYVDNEKFKQEKRSAVNAGDIVMAKIGARCGASAILPKWHQTGILSGNALKITVDNTRHSTYYIWQVLWNLYLRGSTESLRTVGAQPAISMANLKKYKIPLPPLPEQTAIANTLSDADALISSLERLIIKKRHLKRGAMQDLLTGNKCLPGFSGERKIKQLEELVTTISSGIYGVENHSGGLVAMPVATTAHISDDDLWNEKAMQVRFFSREQLAAYSVEEGDLVVVKSSGSAASIKSGKIGLVAKDQAGTFVFSNFLMTLRPKAVISEFIYFYLTSHNVKKLLPSLVEASTYPNIRVNEYLAIDIPVPTSEEQTAIAVILSDMNTEIEGLEHKLAKYRLIKQGIMQELLTGKKRLI